MKWTLILALICFSERGGISPQLFAAEFEQAEAVALSREEKAWRLYEKSFRAGENHKEVAKEIVKDFPDSSLARDVVWHEACLHHAHNTSITLITGALLEGGLLKVRAAARWGTAGEDEARDAKRCGELRTELKKGAMVPYLPPDELGTILNHKPTHVVALEDTELDDAAKALVNLKRGETEAALGGKAITDILQPIVRARTQVTIKGINTGSRWDILNLAYNAGSPELFKSLRELAKVEEVPFEVNEQVVEGNRLLLVAAFDAFLKTADKYDEGVLEAQELFKKLNAK